MKFLNESDYEMHEIFIVDRNSILMKFGSLVKGMLSRTKFQ